MKKWLKENWLYLVIGIALIALVYLRIDSAIATYQYNKQIKAKDVTITELWQKIGDSKKREEKLKVSSEANWILAMDKEAKLRRKDAEMRVKLAEKRALKKKIKEMPVTQVIVRTIEIINCPDVVHQTQGIVFTLDCAKDNLTVLESCFSLKRDVTDWTEKVLLYKGEVADLKNVIIAKDGAYAERGEQLTSAYEVIDEWTGKFKLSEKRGKVKWWKGLKTGGLIGGIVGLLGGFFLAK